MERLRYVYISLIKVVRGLMRDYVLKCKGRVIEEDILYGIFIILVRLVYICFSFFIFCLFVGIVFGFLDGFWILDLGFYVFIEVFCFRSYFYSFLFF